MQLKKTTGFGFSATHQEKQLFLVNFRKWGFIVSVLGAGVSIFALDDIFWRGTLADGFWHGKAKALKSGFEVDFRFGVIIGNISFRAK